MDIDLVFNRSEWGSVVTRKRLIKFQCAVFRYLVEALQRSFLVSAQAPKSIDNASKETTPFNPVSYTHLTLPTKA